MAKIKVKYFGPIKEGYLEEDGWIEVNKVTVFIGNQGSGKSTVAKLISTLTWMEKAFSRGDITKEGVTREDLNTYFEYQRIEKYFYNNTIVEYEGEYASIKIEGKMEKFSFDFKKERLSVMPKIMYVPAERNFFSVVQNAYNVTNLPYTLKTFGEELKKSMLALSEKGINLPVSYNETTMNLPIGNVGVRYDKIKDKIFLKGSDFDLDITDASSGFQSFVPLYVVTRYLINEVFDRPMVRLGKLSINQALKREEALKLIEEDSTLNDEEKTLKRKEVSKQFYTTSLINIVEEPEQNLFPNSQMKMLFSLLGFNNDNEGNNKLILTTHSPYIISYLNLAIQGGYLLSEIDTKGIRSDFGPRLNEIVPLRSITKSNEVSLYEMDEINGTITKLKTSEGVLSDDNYLNQSIRESNEMFDKLLEIEEEL